MQKIDLPLIDDRNQMASPVMMLECSNWYLSYMQYFNSCKLSSEIAAVTIQKLGFRHTLGIYERDNTFLCSEVLNCDDGIHLCGKIKLYFYAFLLL